MDIRIDDLSGAEIQKLLTEHLEDMHTASPAECVHALDLTELKKPNILFWTVWENTQLLGCGALKTIDNQHGEIKSMRTTSAARNKGVASTLLSHILDAAGHKGFKKISLETGPTRFLCPRQKALQKTWF